MKTVGFLMLLASDTDDRELKSRLEKMAADVKGEMRFEQTMLFQNQGLKCISCTTMQCTYEMVFCAALDYDSQSKAWKQVTAATIPPEFKGRILYIEVKRNCYEAQ